ncbi:histidine phosphatase family protein [Adhaeribacter radiodurans]|uniref:Histidine phosphatase family protein n=1 Tax=Adhaeribacter radiodurans TaxID=2745197 RepID=A0A7L7L4V4_9BACT|nr:histidine phosphatase family protein [Adhaeribacter radiodurans]QMU27810.1 histidine phosphatase family protein [Adhaeribacter radiodurans]
MKKIILITAAILASLLTFYFFSAAETNEVAQGNKSKVTVVYLVRHAEKDTANPDEKDPDLTPNGYARAKALQRYLQNTPIDVFLATPYKRTRLTLEPTAAGREISTYQAHGYKALQQLIKQKYAGKTILVAGHSNTLLDIIETLGALPPVTTIADSKYDYIFKVTLRPGKKPKVETATYGTPTT